MSTGGDGARVHAAFAGAGEARDAIGRLVDAGVAAADIDVRSSIPLEGLDAMGLVRPSRVPRMALLGALVGGTAAFLLASLSAMAYPLPTGGMPIVPLPTVGVITFEGTAVGAILCTVATVLLEGRILSRGRGPGPLDARVAAGEVVVSAPEAAGAEWAAGAEVVEG